MSQCPKCAHNLADEYGMVTCPQCRSIVFIDMDGDAQIAEPPVESAASDEPSLAPSPALTTDGPAAANEFESLGAADMPLSASDPLGLVEFSNSEASQAKDGLLHFKILISGIDSKEMRDFLREAITDARLNWDPDQIMSQIHQGVLKIENVSPVKATIVINRIKRLPLHIRWEQNAVTQVP